METICGVCNTVRSNSKHGTSFQRLLTELRREFRKQGFELKILTARDKNLNSEEFYVNAYYDAEDDKNKESPIEVIVHHNFNKELMKEMCERLYDHYREDITSGKHYKIGV